MNNNELKKLAEKASLEVNDPDLDYFKRSFSVVLPMVTDLLTERIANNTSAMERIISAPLGISELSRVRHQLAVDILSKEEIERNSPLKSSRIIVSKGSINC